MSKTYVSIITINYNNVLELKNTFESVFSQNYQDFEYIVIDGGSTDGSKALIEQYSDQIDYWVSEPDMGIYDAMNKGIAKGSGDYLYFLNSGDTFYNAEVLDHITKLLDSKKTDIIYGNVNDVNEETGASAIRPKTNLDKIELFHKMVCHQALFCHRRLFQDNLFKIKYKIKADFEWLLHAFSRYTPKVLNTDFIIANYLLGGLSEVQYDTYSRKEIPLIRNTYFSEKEQKALRRFVFNPKITQAPFGNVIKKGFKQYFRLIYPNLS
ncbi:glycosyltransferase family 2 protein [Mangrovimonas sp. YM274]|uniref:glycosyltransferase family 2 protein n=1 Tax=Mangrovimonas sp. YM274 TaxID=3070660 RepID=UPI0027DD2D44|nr:glycosyltransferase family 2 protein [Mangrovimonas sp. YM274]WMI68457.1 glycosyltransferase family 2 protein [Mangrovimonas sp. YM274]